MGNCLKTQLKAEVSNDSLYKLGVITINRVETTGYAAEAALIQTNCLTAGVKFKIVGDGHFTRTIDGQQIDVDGEYTTGVGGDVFYSTNGNYIIEVEPKYDAVISQLGSGNKMNVEQLNYTPSYQVKGGGMFGDFASLDADKITRLETSIVTGTWNSILRLTKLERLTLQTYTYNENINTLGVLTSLTLFAMPSKMTGSLESLVAAYRSQPIPRTEGELSITYMNNGGGSVTFNGSLCTSQAGAKTLSWTASTITYDGVTINA